MNTQSSVFWATLLCVSSLALSGCNSSSGGGTASNDPPSGNGSGNGNGDSNGDGNNNGDGSGDSSGLSVVQTYPADGATLVPLNAIIRAELNNDINESFQDELIKLYQGAMEVPGQGQSTALPYNEIRFTPSSPLEKDTEYSVTLFADLEDNQFNELGVNYNWTFRTLAKDWTTEAALTANLEAAYLSRGQDSSRIGDRYDGPEIAMNSQGDAVVAWSRVLANNFGMNETDLVVRLFDSETGDWSSPEILGRHEFRDAADGGAYRPGVAINSSGDILIAYPSNNESGQTMIVYQWDGDDWSDTTIATDSIASTLNANGYYRSARVVMDDAGSAVVVWGQRLNTSDDSTSPYVWASSFDSVSGQWDSNPTSLSLAMSQLDLGGRHFFNRLARHPDVAMDSSGNAMAVWIERHKKVGHSATPENYHRTPVARFYNANTESWESTAALLDAENTRVRIESPIRVESLGDNGFIALWADSAATVEGMQTNARLRASLFQGGNWGDAVEVGEVTTTPTFKNIDISTNGQGDAVIVWTGRESGEGQLFERERVLLGRVYKADGGWQEVETLFRKEGNFDLDLRLMQAQMNEDGTAIVVSGGSNQTGTNDSTGLFHHSYDGNSWLSPYRLVENQFGGTFHRLGSNGLGDAILVHGGTPGSTSGQSALYFRLLD